MPHKDKEEHKKYQREYQKKWKKKNKDRWKEICKKSESRPERKEYVRKWWKESPNAKEIRRRFNKSEKAKLYHNEWRKNNPDKVRLKSKKYNKTAKGRLNRIKKVENRRIKFKKISGVYYNVPTLNLIKFVDERDKECVYCRREFSKDNNSKRYGTYDHLDAFKMHSKTNTVKCCSSCNSSKGDRNVWEWLNKKGLVPSKVIFELAREL